MIKIANLVRPNILSLQPYSSARDEFKGKEGVFLDANENPFGSLNRYPDPHQRELKQMLSKEKNANINTIFVGNGSDEVIDLAFSIFCRPGIDKAITFTPTYGMYEVSAAINDVELIKIPLKENFQIDLEKVNPFLSDSTVKLMFICSPNNPTGNLINKNEIEYLLNNFNGIIFVDEAYIDFSKEKSIIELLNQYNNLIISQTFSKAWGLAAARVGLAYASEEIIQFYNKVKPPYNVSTINQKAAIDALHNRAQFDLNLAAILEQKELLINELTKLDLVKKTHPSDANFLLIEVYNADKVYNDLVLKKIIVRNRAKQVANCIRISIGTAAENRQLIDALKKIK